MLVLQVKPSHLVGCQLKVEALQRYIHLADRCRAEQSPDGERLVERVSRGDLNSLNPTLLRERPGTLKPGEVVGTIPAPHHTGVVSFLWVADREEPAR